MRNEAALLLRTVSVACPRGSCPSHLPAGVPQRSHLPWQSSSVPKHVLQTVRCPEHRSTSGVPCWQDAAQIPSSTSSTTTTASPPSATMPALRSLLVPFLLLPALALCGLVDQIERAIVNMVDCATCHSTLPMFKNIARLGDDVFVRTIITACNDLRIEDRDVCEGAIRTQGPILAHDLRHFSLFGQTATKFCDAVFGLCEPPPVNEHSVPFPKPAPANPTVFTSSGKPPFQVIHFSDVHIDRQYTAGTEVNCTKPICCRDYEEVPKPKHIKVHAGRHGSRRCDSPVSLADSMLEAAQHFGGSATFSIFTGDVIDHAVWQVDEDYVSSDIQAFSNQFIEKLNSPLFPALGQCLSSIVLVTALLMEYILNQETSQCCHITATERGAS
ncbi:hypothetical protein AcV7_004224 [Taiwanofungus camphoratus]|nr:hypothetical protein AcV7_004224 [Antrodia cinnamomea]